MGDYKITIVNNTGKPGTQGRHVNTMLFQTMPKPLRVDSYSSAWKVEDVQSPGSVGPIDLPEKVEFYVLDKTPKGDNRASGPTPIKFGQEIVVSQADYHSAPSCAVSGSPQPGKQIKVTNKSGNVQPLEMALYKNGSKMVSFKGVDPADSCYLSIEPVLYIANVEEISEGTDFKATVQADKATPLPLYADTPEIKIEITQKPSGEVAFSLLKRH